MHFAIWTKILTPIDIFKQNIGHEKKKKRGCLVYIHKPLIVATNNVSPQCALRASKMSEKLLTVKDLWRKKEEAEG